MKEFGFGWSMNPSELFGFRVVCDERVPEDEMWFVEDMIEPLIRLVNIGRTAASDDEQEAAR